MMEPTRTLSDLETSMRQTSQGCLQAHRDFRQILRQPLPYQKQFPLTRGLVRLMTLAAGKQVLEIQGNLDLIAAHRDSFIVALNHNQRLEAVLIPSLLFYYRQGKPIHFMADWNFLLMPGVATLYRRSQTIIVTNKKIRPAILNLLKPLYRKETSAFDRALAHLQNGAPIGIFPEGVMNRNPNKLLRGLPGTAKLSLLSGAPVVPMGIRFPNHNGHDPIPDGSPMTLIIGEPLEPPTAVGPLREQTAQFHSQIMTELSKLSGKTWHQANKRRNHVSQ